MWWYGNFKPSGKTALIIGASQGIGAEFAHQLFASNCSVILVARTESKLQAQKERIEAAVRGARPAGDELAGQGAATVSYLACDVSDYDSCAQLWDTLFARGQDPDYIFCCVGSSVPKLFEDLTAREIKADMTTNYDTVINVVHSGFKRQIQHEQQRQALPAGTPPSPFAFKHRHLVLFSSVVAFYSFIGYASYGPAKAAISSLSVILRQELGPYNYRVTCTFPGNFSSEAYAEEMLTKPEITRTIEGPSAAISPAAAARAIIAKLDGGYDTVTTDFIGWLLGCSVLGVLPRTWGLLQILASLVFSIVEPIASWVVYRDIIKYFKKRDEDLRLARTAAAKDKSPSGSALVAEVDDIETD